MPSPLVAAISFSLSQVLLSGLLLCQQRPWRTRESLFAVLLLAVAAYLVIPLTRGSAWGWLPGSLQTLVPCMFWLFSASIFDDHFRLRGWQILLVVATVFPPLVGRVLRQFADIGLDWLLFTLPQALEFVLLGLTLWVVSRYWKVDLVESRRRLRLWFVGLNGVYIFALIFSSVVLFSDERWYSSWQYLPVGGILLAMNALLLRYKREVFFSVASPDKPGPPPEAPPVAAAADERITRSLEELMEERHAYREMGLTIGQLAERLEVPQYRLRQMINAGLGYRNFSDFLNHYRVGEAAARLADPSEAGLPVLTIAMDAGFRSLSSFNKAFKDKVGVTPTGFRKSLKHPSEVTEKPKSAEKT